MTVNNKSAIAANKATLDKVKANAKKLGNPKAQGTNGTALIGELNALGRTYTNVRNAVIAHLLDTGVKGVLIARESKVSEGDVSRIRTMLKALPPKGKVIKSVQSLNLASIKANVTNPSGPVMTEASKLGENFVRKDKNKTTPKTDDVTPGNKLPVAGTSEVRVMVPESGKAENVDIVRAAFDYLVSVSDEEYPSAKSAFMLMLENVDVTRAERQAEADAA